MTKRAGPIAGSLSQARSAARSSTPAGRDGVAERVLGLQRVVGNAAAMQLLRVPGAAAPAAAPAAPATARERFEAQMRGRWGVTNTGAGTEAHQVDEMRRMTPAAEASPSAISGWQEWQPPADSDLYDDILDAFEAMSFTLGGIPEVNTLRFLATDYANVGGTAEARPRHGATYSGGLLNVFRRMESTNWPLPTGRSEPGRPAVIAAGSTSESRRRILVHELAHGVFERFGNPTVAGGSLQFFRDWDAAAGWANGRLEQNGTRVTAANFNEPWPEQPVSGYATSNSMEDFAESLMCFVEEPAVLRARSPARHQFIASRVGSWRAGLRQPAAMTRPSFRLRGPKGDFNAPTGEGRYA